MASSTAIAVVGLDCVLPGAPDADTWIAADTPAFRPIPAGRWPIDPTLAVDPKPGALDAASCAVGGFVDPAHIRLDGLDLGGVPVAELDPLFGLTLHVVRGALAEVHHAPERAALFLANLGLPSSGAVRATAGPWLERGEPVPWLSGGHALDRWQSFGPARLAKQVFGLCDAVALDAACASGLYALQLAADQLLTGQLDVAIAGAVNRSDSSYLCLGFSQLRALSPSGTARPLDRRADGLLVGEGAVAVALKRLDDALRDGDRIHAILRGAGLGNDGRKGNMLAPDGAGQMRAMQAAWHRAGVDPSTLGAVECHATGTPLGDGVELTSLERLLESAGGASTPVALGAAKTLVGHTVTAAGLAGLVRMIGNIRGGMLPAVPQVEEPHPVIEASSQLRVLTQREPWEGFRRGAVSAFGFGGTNAHVILEQFDEGVAHPLLAAHDRSRLAVVGLGVQIGTDRGPAALHTLSAGLTPEPAQPALCRGGALPEGTYVSEVRVDPRRFRIPPVELADLLPQQLLMLDVAADALEQAPDLSDAVVGSIVGMGLDHHIGESVLRWAYKGAGQDPDEIGPPLTASRVQGSLPNFAANRIAAQFDLQGPSWTVSSGENSGIHALQQAQRLIDSGACDAVLVGAVDLPGHVGAVRASAAVHGERPVVEGAVAVMVMSEQAALEAGHVVLFHLDPAELTPASTQPDRQAEALEGLLGVLEHLPAMPAASDAQNDWDPVLAVPHASTRLPAVPRWSGSWGEATLPVPLPAEPQHHWTMTGPVQPNRRALDWHGYMRTPPAPARSAASDAAVMQAATGSAPPPIRPRTPTPMVSHQLTAVARMANEVGRSAQLLADQHGRFLEDQAHAARSLARLADALDLAGRALAGESVPIPTRPLPAPAPPVPTTPVALPPAPRSFDRAALLAHAGDRISDCMGPTYADLDGYTPRVRMPLPPLLLCDRVITIEGERGVFGPSRIVTEYDIPEGMDWSADGRPPPCVMVESGQADLFLVSWLGIDAELKGTRVYRLLDCDLTFHGPRPEPGETLRHDIRIDRFARLGSTTLFYFHYDCIAVSDGRPVLSMRNGCAGFFTPEELATPRGVVAPVADIPSHPGLAPLVAGAPTSLGPEQVQALAEGNFGRALGPAFAGGDGSALRLPRDPRWRLVHRVPHLTTSGGPHGLGEVVFEQVLRDDDWFNPCHFVDDPCMPGTLMFDGCQQAVQLWLLARGAATHWPQGRFDPLPDVAARLRCRGQVVPGHSLLRYTARIKDAGDSPSPWAIADVILEVDGTEVVLAEDVSCGVFGERRAAQTVPDALVMEYSVGSAERAFGPQWSAYDSTERCARMPGPPYLTMSRVSAIDHPPMQITAPASVTIEWDVPDEAWFWEAAPGESLAYAIVLEAALQPCGWLTAWQGMSIEGGRDLYFRNLGGKATQHVEVWPHTGTLSTTATLTSTSASGGIRVVFFTSRMYAGETLVFECTTNFGYFSSQALSAQKGLQPPSEDMARIQALVDQTALDQPVSLQGHSALPRDDWRMLHHIDCASATAGQAGLGFYRGVHTVDPDRWFFHAHFHLDPVMPGSLGLEALLQLARYALVDHLGPQSGRFVPLTLNQEVSWTYRGQVLRHVSVMTAELEVLAIEPGPTPSIRCTGIIRADGLPIYRFEDFGLQVLPEAPALPAGAPAPNRPSPADALLDQFEVQGDTGTGTLLLDPAVHPWLADHCPTVTAPAVPLAFAVEIAAEAAAALRPGLKVAAVPVVEADAWIHTADGPVELLIAAVADGDTVAVSLAVHEHNERFPQLSGPKVRMKAVVQMHADWSPTEPAPEVTAGAVDVDVRQYYDGGHTFHGPTLQAMTGLTHLDPTGAVATLKTRSDADLLGLDARFTLDPLLLDAATHPMWSAEPQRWQPELGPGHLAYPIRAENMRFFGPRPEGEVTCRLVSIASDPGVLAFDVHLQGPSGPWCAYRWTEAIVEAGPWLGLSPEQRLAFLWNRQPCSAARIGRADGDGWRVQITDLVEPLPGTLVRMACRPRELVDRAQAPDPALWDCAMLAAKERVRQHLRDHLDREVHPTRIVLLRMRPDRFVVLELPDLTAEQTSRLAGPTRWNLDVACDERGATARLLPVES